MITCEPRSGSTWLMELLGSHPEILLNWEPLHKRHGVTTQYSQVGWRPMIRTYPGPEIVRLFHHILTFRVSTQWSRKFIGLAGILKARYVLTKFVRANGALLWMIDQFQLKYQPVYLVRHPVSVATSQLRQFGELSIEDVSRDAFGAEQDDALAALIHTLDSNLQFRVLLWCVMNAPLLQRARSANCPFLTIFYEDLLMTPLDEINKIRQAWGILSDFGEIDFALPSRSDFKQEYLSGTPDLQLNKHLEALDGKDARQIQKILDFFDIREYHVHSAYPQKGTGGQ